MKLQAILEVSQDGHNWTPFGESSPIPVAMLTGYAFVRVVLVWTAEPGDVPAYDLPPPKEWRARRPHG